MWILPILAIIGSPFAFALSIGYAARASMRREGATNVRTVR